MERFIFFGFGLDQKSTMRHVVKYPHYASLISRRRRIVLRTVAAAVVFIDHAPPATTFLQALQPQIPTALRLTVSLPQNEHV